MTVPALDTASVGAPLTRLEVSFFPIYLPGNELPEIATGEGSGLVVGELDRERVNTLSAKNPTGTPILLVEGEHFLGGMQNRVVNRTVLLPPGEAREIPVTCLEARRWAYGPTGPPPRETASPEGTPPAAEPGEDGEPEAPGAAPPDSPPRRRHRDPEARHLRRSAAMASRRLRRVVRTSMAPTLGERGGDRADQGAAWDEVEGMMARYGAESASASAAEAEERVFHRDRRRGNAVRELMARGPLPHQNGVAVTHGEKVVAVDLFGTPALLAAHWPSLVRSHLLELPEAAGQPSAARALWGVRRPTWMKVRPAPALGLGEEFHAHDDTLTAHALALEGRLVHAGHQFAG